MAYSPGARRPRQGVSPVEASKVGVLMTPEQIASSGTEHGHQSAFFQWIAIDGVKRYADLDLFHAIPNGGDRQAHVGASLKAEGVKSGVPDTCLPLPAGRYAGLYIEFKRPGMETKENGALSPNQVKWCGRLAGQHYAVAVAYSWDQAVAVVHRYMAGAAINDRDGPTFMSVEVLRDWGHVA